MMVRQRMTLCLLFLLGFLYHTPMQAQQATETIAYRSLPHRSIRIEGIGGEEEAWIRKKIALRDDSEVSPEEIDAFPYSHR